MMKRTLAYIGMVVSMLFVLTSCTSDIFESFGDTDDATDGVPVTLTFTAALPGGGIKTRTPQSIENLTLLVFNDKHRYLYRAKATLEKIETAPSGIVFEPHDVAHGPISGTTGNVYKFTVTLMTSTKPRIIHFVADYMKDGKTLDETLDSDQALENADEGEVMPRIISEDTKDYTYWQAFWFDKIDQHIFENKGFELLRDKAKITIKDNTSIADFELKGFSVHNAPNRGTIAAYASKKELTPHHGRDFYRDVLYTFPVDPTEATIPSDIQLINLGDTKSNLAPIPVFEYSNSQAEADKQMSVILYGKGKADHDYSYYKLDIVRDIYTDPEHKQGFIGTQRFDIIRNYNYVITIISSKGKGYPTYEEAVRNPASNNLFGSVELQQYSDVTDGEYTLIVDNTNAIMTLPGHFYSPITFVGADLVKPSEHVRVYLNQKLCNGPITDDPYIDYAEYDQNTGVLHVNVKSIPTDADQRYEFNVVGAPPNSTTHIQRTITLILRKRYDFKLQLEEKTSSKAQGSEVDLKFTVPGTLPATLFPFEVYVAADQLSPLVNSTYNDQMKVLKQGKRTYYAYTVRTPSATGTDKEITLHFQRTRSNGTCDVTLSSENFNNADAILPNDNSTPTNNRGKLTYTGISYTVPKIVPSEYRTKLEVTGVSGVTAKMASAGYVEFTGLNAHSGNTPLTLTATMGLGNGTVKATKTLGVDEWKQLLTTHQTMNLDISEVTVEEKANYKKTGATAYEQVPNGTLFTVNSSETSIHVDINSTGAGTYKMTVTGLANIKRPVSFTCFATIDGVQYETNSIYLSKIIDHPVMNMTTHLN